jgi:hypothetical protein
MRSTVNKRLQRVQRAQRAQTALMWLQLKSKVSMKMKKTLTRMNKVMEMMKTTMMMMIAKAISKSRELHLRKRRRVVRVVDGGGRRKLRPESCGS